MWHVCFGADLPELTHFSYSYNGFPVLKLELFERPEGFLTAPNNKLSSKASSPNNPSPMFRRTKQVFAGILGVWGVLKGDSLSLAVEPGWQWLQPDGYSGLHWSGDCRVTVLIVLWMWFLPAPFSTRAPVEIGACCAVPSPFSHSSPWIFHIHFLIAFHCPGLWGTLNF